MFSVKINQKEYQFENELTILDAAKKIGVSIPTLCHDSRLKPYGGCRLCVVDVKGWPRPAVACTTPIFQGMVVDTHTPEIEEYRRTLLNLLSADYPLDTIQKYPDKEFHRYLRFYDIQPVTNGRPDNIYTDHSHPYIDVDMKQCINCYRCVRICDELQGQFAWKIWNRGISTHILPDSGNSLATSSCVSCGACVDTCPTGALEDKSILAHGIPTDWTRTTCPYCGTGCEMKVGTRDNKVINIRPVLESPTNKGHLCVKGRFEPAVAR